MLIKSANLANPIAIQKLLIFFCFVNDHKISYFPCVINLLRQILFLAPFTECILKNVIIKLFRPCNNSATFIKI